MKNVLKTFSIIALVAIIGFSMAACGSGGDDDGPGDGKTVTRIVIIGSPTKTTYVVGDKLDTSGLVVRAFYSDGTEQDVTGYTTNFDSSTPGTKTVTVSYRGKTATPTFTVTVYAKGGSGTFNSIYDFEVWLTAQPNNTATSPHTVKLNLSSLEGGAATAGSVGYIIRANANKYLSLDLSGCSITSIVDYPFHSCHNLTGVTIPNSVTSIGHTAFVACSLTSLNIPASVTSIGIGAFYNCTNLSSVNIPAGVTEIEEDVFSSCSSLASITIPNGVTSIGYEAFRNCTSLTSVTIPAGVTSIANFAFIDCPSLTSVTFLGENSSSVRILAFDGNLRDKYLDANGGIGTYVRVKGGSAWTKQ